MAAALTKEQLDAVNETYTFFDFAKNDQIATSELKSMYRSLGQNPTEQDIKDMIVEIDPALKGYFSRAQWVKLMSNGWLKDFSTLEQELRDAFKFFDKSGDGKISHTEMRFALMKTGDAFDEEEFEEMMKLADADHDGQISYEEFIRWFSGGRILLTS